MNNLWLYLVIIPLAGNVIAEWSNLIQTFKYWIFFKVYDKRTTRYKDFRLKPLDCALCTSFWIAALSLLITYSSPLSILWPWASAGAATIISKLFYKL